MKTPVTYLAHFFRKNFSEYWTISNIDYDAEKHNFFTNSKETRMYNNVRWSL